jgi:FkbM family methyltransferase
MRVPRLREAVRRGATRATFAPRPDSTLQRVGSDYGGWYIPPIDPGWVCCTVGVGEDATFDVALAEHGCQVLAIDPTPRAIAHVEPLVASHETLHLAPYALWTEPTELAFFPPANSDHVSFSATNLQDTHDPIVVPARPLAEIMHEFGFRQAQLVKLDIEGAEFRVLPALDLNGLDVRVLCVEFHFQKSGFGDVVRTIRGVEKQGFRAARMDHTNVTFLRR